MSFWSRALISELESPVDVLSYQFTQAFPFLDNQPKLFTPQPNQRTFIPVSIKYVETSFKMIRQEEESLYELAYF